MAIQGPIPVRFEQVFPHGCFIVGEVEQVKDFDASSKGRTVYAKDKNTGELVWQVAVMDADPTVKAGTRRNGARWSVALALGIRQGEALGLRWQYVDLDTGVIRAWFQIQRAEWQHGCADPHKCGEKWHRWPCKKKCSDHGHNPGCKEDCKKQGHTCFKRTCLKDCTSHADRCPKRTGGGIVFRQRKGKSKLTLQCPPELLALLKAHRKIQAAERLKAGDRWEDHDLVFATRHGGPIERTEDWKVWKTILKQAGVRDIRVHDARHTAATLLIEQGVNIRVVQEVLGHTRVTTTERYAHVSTPLMRDAGERLASALWGKS
ncbi:tyrosine-type recombinase/integrase [Streptosporangium amethystogenes]|uniref:tyrosine-type recombinase/integrase n=1 Tax=Streptosporangium amethystogenes TaxID=2002 RepID=UPI0037963B08